MVSNEDRIKEELAGFANAFADVYTEKGLTKGHTEMMEILSKVLHYDKRMVLSAFRTALKARGVRSVEGLLH